jgi:HYR domain-containing protein
MRRIHVFSASLSLVCACAMSAWGQSIRHESTRPAPWGDGVWRTASGKVTLLLDVERIHDLGFELQTLAKTAASDTFPRTEATFAFSGGRDTGILFASRGGRFSALAGGGIPTDGEMLIARADGETFRLGNFDFHVSVGADGSAVGSVTDRLVTSREVFRFSGGIVQFEATTGRLEWGGAELTLDANYAHEVSLDAAAGEYLGTLLFEAEAVPSPELAPSDPPSPPPGEGDDSGPYGLVGPDVIVGDLQDTSRYGVASSITAFSVGTTSCNIGTVWLNWISSTNQHPVIGQNMYRLKNGRFEQIGMSWLKHGFFALSGGLCFADCQATDGTHLGVHCSDPYGSSLNGDQSNLGPRWQVNAATGNFTYPPANPAAPATIGRRLQVHNTDLDPGQNAGALYFVEGQYVTPDDAAANNKNNNASYRRVNITGAAGSGTYDLQFNGTTQRQKAGIQAWKDNDAAVTLVDVDVPSDGRLTLGYKVTNNGNGTWHYEYALYNMNSDRSGQAFTIPLATGVSLSNVQFHDVDYHSGDRTNNTSSGTVAFDGTDWAPTITSSAITWATSTFAQDPNANALRWGTLYNFRFDANTAPVAGNATLGLFKTGSPGSMTVATQIPTSGVPCVDQTPPVITCPANQTAEATSSAGAAVAFTPTATDDCTPNPAIACTPASGSTFALGSTNVNCTATDLAMRTASCSFSVTVRDTTPPTLTCGNVVRECTSPSGANVSYTVTASDAVDPSPTVSCNPSSGSSFAFGATTVNCTASDHATPPNSRNCSFTVTVRDTTAPTVTCPGNQTTDCTTSGGIVTFSTTASDACDTTPTVTCVPPSGSAFSVGTTTVTCTARDDSNNASSCSFHVTVNGGSPCFLGSVNTSVGSPANVFFVNGSAGTGCVPTVNVAINAPITLHMDAAPSGFTNGEYALYVWRAASGFGSNDASVGGQSVGCTVLPTPLGTGAPQPFKCLHGGVPASYCGTVSQLASSPARAPWTLNRNQGFNRALRFTLQGVLADFNANNGVGMSTTNALVLDVH